MNQNVNFYAKTNHQRFECQFETFAQSFAIYKENSCAVDKPVTLNKMHKTTMVVTIYEEQFSIAFNDAYQQHLSWYSDSDFISHMFDGGNH